MTDTPESLQVLVEAARNQPIVETGVSADAVLAGMERARSRSLVRRSLILSSALAVAASTVAVVSVSSLLGGSEQSPMRAAGVEDKPTDAQAVPETPPPRLASAVSLRTNAAVEIHGPWSIALGEGEHELAMRSTPGRSLRVTLPDRELELVEGRALVQVVEGSSVVRLEVGVAAWIGPGEQRTLISVERSELEVPTKATSANTRDPRPPSAAQLAREAEARLAAGKTGAAIAILRQLVATHPRASPTRAGLLDLARLLRKTQQVDAARCAYTVYLQRWPGSAVDAEVRSQLAQLGEGPGCRGLDPR